jgi:Ni/Fe-hydrogenase subunit HybB-like protein
MDYALPNEAAQNYIFPNEVEIPWSLMIVVYPYVTGLIAGAFVVSSLYHVFKIQAFARIARFALLLAFCFGLVAGIPLQLHLTQPFRALNIFSTPHFTAAMSVFGYVYASYMLLLSVELWLVYREFFIRKANETNKLVWRVLTLGVREYTPKAAAVDHKLISILAGIGIPAAFALHGYVGFIFGSIKAVPWWATPLQPIIFILSTPPVSPRRSAPVPSPAPRRRSRPPGRPVPAPASTSTSARSCGPRSRPRPRCGR